MGGEDSKAMTADTQQPASAAITPPRRNWSRWVIVSILAGVIAWHYYPKSPSFQSSDVTSIIVELEGTSAPQRMTHKSVCNDVFEVLRKAQSTSEHKCASVGSLKIGYTSGIFETIEILPGHDLEHYEFRLDGRSYRVPRDAFFRALEKGGVDTSKFPRLDGEGAGGPPRPS